MSDAITLSEVQEFIAGFWYHYDQGHFESWPLRIGDEMDYVSRSELAHAHSRNCCLPNCTAAPRRWRG